MPAAHQDEPAARLEPIDERIAHWLERRLDEDASAWLEERLRAVRTEAHADPKRFYLAFGLAARRIPDEEAGLSDTERERARALRPGWEPWRWTLLDLARTRLLLALPAEEPARYGQVLDALLQAADFREQVSIYQALAVLPHPASHRERTARGLRTNIKAVFAAIAHHNPYPREELPEPAWNQMVLKALFVGLPLKPIQGLLERANPRLTRMLSDYAHERLAAGRSVPGDLWLVLAQAPDAQALADLRLALETGAGAEREALIEAIALSPDPRVKALVAAEPRVRAEPN